VAVARAIAVKPKVFLMDEPLSNLDAKLRNSMRTELKAIHTKTDATTVFVTHDQSEAMSMADRIVIMRDGEIVQTGTPDDVYFRSGSIFVAGFIGTPPTNFMDVNLSFDDGEYHLQNDLIDMNLNGSITPELQSFAGKILTIGVRPENFRLVTPEEAVLSAECLVSEPQGSHQIIAIEVDNKIMKFIAPPLPRYRPGEMIYLSFDQDSIHFFDKETGNRI
jgi:multiple sugar transport system ATP-binding protein